MTQSQYQDRINDLENTLEEVLELFEESGQGYTIEAYAGETIDDVVFYEPTPIPPEGVAVLDAAYEVLCAGEAEVIE